MLGHQAAYFDHLLEVVAAERVDLVVVSGDVYDRALPQVDAAALAEAMRRVHADLATRPGARSVVLAHAFVAGAEPSDSERDISVGGVSRVPTSVFDGVDYAALGHLHGPHTLTDRIRYSGSPL